MFCPKCGKQLSDNAKFCPGCGASIQPRQAQGTRRQARVRASQAGDRPVRQAQPRQASTRAERAQDQSQRQVEQPVRPAPRQQVNAQPTGQAQRPRPNVNAHPARQAQSPRPNVNAQPQFQMPTSRAAQKAQSGVNKKVVIGIVAAVVVVVAVVAILMNTVLAKPTLASAARALENADSYTCNMSLSYTASALGQSASGALEAESKYVKDPIDVAVDIKTVSTVNGKSSTNATAGCYLVKDADDYLVYYGSSNSSTVSNWKKGRITDASKATSGSSSVSSLGGVATILEKGTGVKESGSETIDGVDCLKLDGTLSGEALRSCLNELVEKSEMTSSDKDAYNAIINYLGETNFSVWLDKKSANPVRIEINFDDVIKNALSSTTAISYDSSCKLTYEFKDFGTTTVEVPSNVKTSAKDEGAISWDDAVDKLV